MTYPDTGLARLGSNILGLIAGGSVKLQFNGNAATGDAVQASSHDTTLGRLLNTAAFGIASGAAMSDGNVDNALIGGEYFGYCGLHTSASTGTNPFANEGGAFHLSVRSGVDSETNYVIQIATPYNSGIFQRRIRTKTTSGWGPWLNGMTPNEDGEFSMSGVGAVATVVTIADDAVAAITTPTEGGSMFITSLSGTAAKLAEGGIIRFGVGATPVIEKVGGGASFAVSTGNVTGTTGTNGNVTASARNNGTIKIENRAGGSRDFHVLCFAA